MGLTGRRRVVPLGSHPWRLARGFTLIELVLVMVIVGIMGAMAVPRFVGFLGNARADATVSRILADLKATRCRAKQTGQCQSIVFDTMHNQYAITGWESLDRRAGAYAVDLADEPYQATLVTADFDGSATLGFDGWGQPVSDCVLKHPIADGTITISAGGQTRSVRVRSTTIPADDDPGLHLGLLDILFK